MQHVKQFRELQKKHKQNWSLMDGCGHPILNMGDFYKLSAKDMVKVPYYSHPFLFQPDQKLVPMPTASLLHHKEIQKNKAKDDHCSYHQCMAEEGALFCAVSCGQLLYESVELGLISGWFGM
jgi:hypothetical protein